MRRYIEPHNVISPKRRWILVAVLDQGSEEDSALAIGRWDNEPALAMRWNGSNDNPIGNPQSRGLPTWFVVPEKYREWIIRDLPEDKRQLVRSFFSSGRN